MKELKPITKKRLSEEAIESIKEYIVNNNLKPGDKLPSERQLSKDLKVSRGAIRETLRMLEITGLIKVKSGKGVFVEALTSDLYVPLSTWVSKHKENILKHFEARLILEPEITYLSAQRATRGNIQKLEKTIKKQLASSNSDLVAAIHADIEFHHSLAESADNWTLEMIMNSLIKVSFEGWKAALRVTGRIEKAIVEHKEIVQMIKDKDAEGAKMRMKEHLLESMKRLKTEGLEQNGSRIS